ncbi:MAG: cation transporter [Pedosphaera sp.]|nr:cation transporter [Pedosphaera sp.]MSU42468.1 cation transporter [Pedosphaera sp.]
MKTLHKILSALACAAAALTTFAADEKPATPQEFKHRVTGLFSTDRVDDLGKVAAQLPDVKLISVDFKTAEAVFSYDSTKVGGGGKPDKAAERLDNLIRNASRSTFGIKPLCTTPRDQLKLIEIGVFGLDCKGCALAAYESIAKLDGVEQATVNFKVGLVTAMIDPKKTDRAALEAALKQKQVELKKQP